MTLLSLPSFKPWYPLMMNSRIKFSRQLNKLSVKCAPIKTKKVFDVPSQAKQASNRFKTN